MGADFFGRKGLLLTAEVAARLCLRVEGHLFERGAACRREGGLDPLARAVAAVNGADDFEQFELDVDPDLVRAVETARTRLASQD